MRSIWGGVVGEMNSYIERVLRPVSIVFYWGSANTEDNFSRKFSKMSLVMFIPKFQNFTLMCPKKTVFASFRFKFKTNFIQYILFKMLKKVFNLMIVNTLNLVNS